VKTRCNLAESSKDGYGSKRAVLPMMMMRRRRLSSGAQTYRKPMQG
jgi:hypothetical protein